MDMIGMSPNMMTDQFIDEFVNRETDDKQQNRQIKAMLQGVRASARKPPLHAQRLLQHARDSKGNYRKPGAFNKVAGKRPVRQAEQPVVINLQSMSEKELSIYSSIFSKRLKADPEQIKRQLIDLKQDNNYLESREVLQKLKKKGNESMINKADFYQNFLDNKYNNKEVYNLTAIEGDVLLPKKMARDILIDYPATNPLRQVMTVTNVKNLEQPILSYVTSSVAKELELTGESLQFENNRDRIIARVSDSIVHGSTSDLEKAIEDSLKNELIKKEYNRIFATIPAAGEEHMSLYHNNIANVSGANIYEAITNAVADLHEDIRINASVVMSFDDYKALAQYLGTIGLGSLAANLKKAFNVKSVVVSDKANQIVVGDFKGLHANYYAYLIDQDKEADSGMYSFAFAFTFDIKIISKLFRLVSITA